MFWKSSLETLETGVSLVECSLLAYARLWVHLQPSPTKDLKSGTNWILAKHSAFQGKGMGREARDCWCVKVSLQVLRREGKLPSRVAWDWHYTPRFNVSQTLNVAVSRCAVIPEWPCSMLSHEWPIPTTGCFCFFIKVYTTVILMIGKTKLQCFMPYIKRKTFCMEEVFNVNQF